MEKNINNESTDLTVRNLSSRQVWDYENGFFWFSHPSRLNKTLAHYDLYKSILDLPGHILEFGVYKGASLIRLASFRKLLENDFSRRIIGFDAFGRFPTTGLKKKEDTEFVKHFEEAGGDGLSVDEMTLLLKRKNFENITLVKGNVLETVPEFLANNPETRIALMHLDMDVKEPSAFVLNELYSRVVPGGVILFDDYNAIAGGTEAVDEFIKGKGLRLEKGPHYHIPCFVRKPLS